MVLVFHFQTHLTIKRLDDVRRQTDDVMMRVDLLKERFARIGKGLRNIEAGQQRFVKKLGAHVSRLNRTMEFARDCLGACELETLDEMIQERDRLKKNCTH